MLVCVRPVILSGNRESGTRLVVQVRIFHTFCIKLSNHKGSIRPIFTPLLHIGSQLRTPTTIVIDRDDITILARSSHHMLQIFRCSMQTGSQIHHSRINLLDGFLNSLVIEFGQPAGKLTIQVIGHTCCIFLFHKLLSFQISDIRPVCQFQKTVQNS